VAYHLEQATSGTSTLADRVLAALSAAAGPLDDDVLTRQLRATSRQTVSLVCRTLEASGRIRRFRAPDGMLVNTLAAPLEADSAPGTQLELSVPTGLPRTAPAIPTLLTENQIKRAVREYLIAQGYRVHVAWGHTRQVDIHAERDGERLLLEAKGQVERRPQQSNDFLGALGELLQRMTDPDATYGLALPDHPSYRALVARLPELIWGRLNLVVYFVSGSGDSLTVREQGRTAPGQLF
jgi:hypothetical protein